MGLYADATALLTRATARWTVRYGNELVLAGSDLDEPETWRVPTRHGTVRCEVYRPTRSAGPPPTYVHFHGGAFLMRHPRMDDFFARFVVARTGAAVVNVDFDVAPLHRYPVAHHQARDVVEWLTRHAAEAGIDGSRLAVGGFSSGGNLAASVCLQLRDDHGTLPRLQLLAVPSVDVSTSDKTATVPNPMIDARLLRLVRATYFKDESRRGEPYASPLLAEDLHGLPPAVVITAERDALRAEGDAYAARLSAAGVDVLHRVVPGRDHYFLDRQDHVQARSWMDLMAGEIGRSLVPRTG